MQPAEQYDRSEQPDSASKPALSPQLIARHFGKNVATEERADHGPGNRAEHHTHNRPRPKASEGQARGLRAIGV